MSGVDLAVDFKSFQDKVSSSLVNATRTAGQISNEDLGFHRSSSGRVSKSLDEQNARLLRLTNKLLKAATEDSHLTTPRLADTDSVDDNWRKIVDVVDDMLEKADASLDEFSGVIKRFSPTPQDATSKPPPRSKGKREVPNIFQNASMPKPQRLFDVKPNNYETKPFRPLLKTKPHAIKSLVDSVGEGGPEGYGHPYATEIEEYKYPSSTYLISPPIPFNPPDSHEAILVDTEEGVQKMLRELKHAKEIAVDLEHHDMHSYVGLVSLMQISTREKDWIVDTLKPWRENLQCLNEVFADPNVVKIFHGANMDIVWLQRDLGLYVVGLFDTYHAAEALNLPGKGLKYLLERFAKFKAQKKYQMADWRVRPLPEELVDYARSDTHYLLYIFDELKNMLLEASTPDTNLIDAVLEGSKKEALQVHERPIYDVEYGLGSGGWFKQVTQKSIKFNGSQLAVYKAVHYWRDQKAREWDEGEQSILTLAQLYNIADTMPTTVSTLYNSLRPMPRLVAANSKELVSVITRAKFQGENGPTLRDVVRTTEEKFGPNNVWGRRRKSPPAENRGVGATLQILAKSSAVTPARVESPDPTSVVDDAESNAGRSLTSRLWGLSLPTLTSINKVTFDSSSVAMQALKSVLPLPKQSENLLSDNNIASSAMDLDQTTPAGRDSADFSASRITSNGIALETLVEDKDEIFTLRDRKRKAIDTEAPIERGVPLSTEDQARKEEKRRRKAEKRAEKEAAAAAAAQVQPFDYANAQSMLNPAANEDGQQRQVVNPYAKALNTSTGAKRMNQEGPGRSFTFKE